MAWEHPKTWCINGFYLSEWWAVENETPDIPDNKKQGTCESINIEHNTSIADLSDKEDIE